MLAGLSPWGILSMPPLLRNGRRRNQGERQRRPCGSATACNCFPYEPHHRFSPRTRFSLARRSTRGRSGETPESRWPAAVLVCAPLRNRCRVAYDRFWRGGMDILLRPFRPQVSGRSRSFSVTQLSVRNGSSCPSADLLGPTTTASRSILTALTTAPTSRARPVTRRAPRGSIPTVRTSKAHVPMSAMIPIIPTRTSLGKSFIPPRTPGSVHSRISVPSARITTLPWTRSRNTT